MQNVIAPGVAAARTTACPLTLSALRRNLLAIVAGNDLFTDGEQVLTNHNAYECGCPLRLALWCRNARRVAAERQAQRNTATLAGMEQGIARFNARVAVAEAKAPTAQQPAEAPATYATEAQCAEVARLLTLPCLTAGEKANVLRRLPALTEGGTVRLLGSLYATALRRTPGVRVFTDGSTRFAA